MAGKLQRCYRCNPPFGKTFQGDKPECPDCNAGPPAVVTLTLVHWLVPQTDGPIRGHHSRFRVACQPQRAVLSGAFPASGEPVAVTCPLCMAAEGFAKALAEFNDQAGG